MTRSLEDSLSAVDISDRNPILFHPDSALERNSCFNMTWISRTTSSKRCRSPPVSPSLDMIVACPENDTTWNCSGRDGTDGAQVCLGSGVLPPAHSTRGRHEDGGVARGLRTPRGVRSEVEGGLRPAVQSAWYMNFSRLAKCLLRGIHRRASRCTTGTLASRT